MKIERIEIAEFRRFRTPLILDGLAPGLNLFVGHNEAGKSTVASALRAAFLERFKTRGVADLAPWGMSQARPTVTVDFQIGESHYHLSKSFLSRPRCELSIDHGRQLVEGEQAEDKLAQLLGFQFAGKGQSKPEHAGIPGLLWITQGDSQHLAGAAQHAGAHLREALTRLSGELSASDGDRLFERVASERAVLLDLRGKPKGAFKQAGDDVAEARAACERLGGEKAALDADVDKLATWRAEYERLQREQPWQVFEARARDARARLAEAVQARDQVTQAERELTQVRDNEVLLREQIKRDRDDLARLDRLSADAARASSAGLAAGESLRVAREALATAQAQESLARRRSESAQARADQRDLADQLARQAGEVERLAASLGRADGLMQKIESLARLVTENEVAPRDLDALRSAQQALAQGLAQQQAVATQLSYRLESGCTLRIGGREVSGHGDTPITERVEIEVPAFGRLTIEPGGRDLPALADAIETATRRRAAALARLNVDDLAQAEARQVAFERSRQEWELARKELALHAPAGLDALRAAHEQARGRHEHLAARHQAALAVAPSPDDERFLPGADDIASANQAWRQAESAVTAARETLARADGRAQSTQSQAQLLDEQVRALRAVLDDPTELAARERRIQALVQAGAATLALSDGLEQARELLARHQPELAEQDLRRFEQSAKHARDQHHTRHGEILQLQGRLEQAGASGVGERLSDAQAALERLERRCAELTRRAAALDMLAEMLQAQRQAATLRLQAPLAERLRHYLPLLFPQGQLHLDDALTPATLARGDSVDQLESLSFGTREQLGVLARLAYADLLQQAGRPTLVVLDDALVHSDDARRDFMKRALFDAASRHQILMFTCHGEAWKDLGVAPRDLP